MSFLRTRRVTHTTASLATLAALACGEPATVPVDHVAALRARLSGGGTQFVLARAGSQVAEPIVQFDRLCWQDARGPSRGTVRRTAVTTDTIMLRADGTVRRAVTLAWFADGVLDGAAFHGVSTGTWAPVARSGRWAYYGDGPSIELQLATPAGGSPTALPLRLRDDGSLGVVWGIGGTCPGPASQPAQADSGEVEYVFTPR